MDFVSGHAIDQSGNVQITLDNVQPPKVRNDAVDNTLDRSAAWYIALEPC